MPLHWVDLIERPQPVASAGGLIYSTRPRVALATDGSRYFIKGPDEEIVVAEVLGSLLAGIAGLRAPEWGLTRVPSEEGVFFASKAKPFRSADLLTDSPANGVVDFLQRCIAYDVWVANDDRNVNNLVADTDQDGTPELFAIDFEKSPLLRAESRFIVEMKPPREWWPKEDLGRYCSGITVGDGACELIKAATPEALTALATEMRTDVEGFSIPWWESAADYLVSRATRISALIHEARP